MKSIFFVMHLGCIFVKTKIAFVAESHITVCENIQIYFLQLDARFNAVENLRECWQVQAREQWDKKICGTVGHSCCWPIIIIS